MRPVVSICLVILLASLIALNGQEPPRALPGSITGTAPPTGVVPAAAATPAGKSAPAARFQNLAAFPSETVQALYGMRMGADWLARMQQPHGRFLAGLNPAIKLPIDGDDDVRQALAAWAVSMSARFTGDDKLNAVAGQAVLAMLSLTRDDPSDATCRIPTVAAGSNAVGFAAALALAAYELPAADTKLIGEAEKLCHYLRKQVRADGSVACGEGGSESDRACLYPGLVLQALTASQRAKPEAWKSEAIARGVAHYRTVFRVKPNAILAGTMLPAAVDHARRAGDKEAAATALEMADWLCASQCGKADTRQILWAGGFQAAADPPAEPGFASAYAARGLAAATHLTRHLPDLTRYAKYRPATVDALGFVRGLQYTSDNTDHFEGKFRSHYLLGGVRLSATDATLRIDATAAAVAAFGQFLESGAEVRD